MSLWARIQYLSRDAKQHLWLLYTQHGLSVEVRDKLAVWIENNILSIRTENENVDENTRRAMICYELVAEIRRVADSIGTTDMFAQFRLHGIADLFQKMPHAELYGKFKACLSEEMRLLYEQTNKQESGVVSVTNQPEEEIEGFNTRQSGIYSQRICTLANKRDEWGSHIETMQLQVNELQIARDRIARLQLLGNQQQQENGFSSYETSAQRGMQKVEQDMEIRIKRIHQTKATIVKLAEWMVTELHDLVPTLIRDYLSKLQWSEVSPEEHGLPLDDIERWYSELLETISQLRRLGTSYLQETSPALIQNVLQQLDSVFFLLITNSLVVQEQPSQVIKKDTKFNTSVRFLPGDKFIATSASPVITVSVINEKYATLLFEKKSPSKVNYLGHGKIVNNVGCRFSDGDSRWSQRVIMQFRNVTISNVLRGEKVEKNQKSGNRAMTEKFCLLFSSKLNIDGQGYEMWCCSVPFVFIVHVSQKCEGWGNIFWDNSFREIGRVPFFIPQEVPWCKLGPALAKCYKSMTETTWNLTEANLKYIGQRIFKTTEFNDDFTISRKQFCEKESTNKPSLWEWVYSTIDLTNKHLKPYWEKGFIIGFMDRSHAERVIQARRELGTFILRFSDSILGAISISYGILESDGIKIRSLAPFPDSELKARSLPDRIHDADQFANVYYHDRDNQERLTAKGQAFPRQNKNNLFSGGGGLVRSSYVQAEVVMVITNTNNNVQQAPQVSTPPPQQFYSFEQMQPQRTLIDSPQVQSPVNASETWQEPGADQVMDDEEIVNLLDELTEGFESDFEDWQHINYGVENLAMPSPEF